MTQGGQLNRLTFRHSGHSLSITHSIQIGIEAIPIWMKSPAWSVISVKGAGRTICVLRFTAKTPSESNFIMSE